MLHVKKQGGLILAKPGPAHGGLAELFRGQIKDRAVHVSVASTRTTGHTVYIVQRTKALFPPAYA
jgi:hypothetical protein